VGRAIGRLLINSEIIEYRISNLQLEGTHN